ncbi:MAG: chemotaxis protein CheR [Rhodobacteraceae bacterium]|jgi:chemotaxis protein methyltransferase CheR|nr:chemotaxis protein CheR [Paracoccaceae bacterium]
MVLRRDADLQAPAPLPAMTPAQCRFFAKLAHTVCRLAIDPAKADFLSLRLSRRVRALGLDGFEPYARLLRDDPQGDEIRLFVEALTTHTTSFFRERHQYDWLDRAGLAMLAESGAGVARPLTVWSAACSSGMELWSTAMLLAEAASKPGGLRRFDLLGTDISRPILRKAAAATYAQDEIAGLPDLYRQRYLMRSRVPVGTRGGHVWRVVPELRQHARFAACNLTDPSSLPAVAADVVFLRNVLIYFKADVQAEVIDAVVGRLNPGGVLLTGHAEPVAAHPRLCAIGPSTYRKE